MGRAYSIASADYDEHLEFFSIVVPGGEFTSPLSRLQVGDPILVEKLAYGFLTTSRFECGRDVDAVHRDRPGAALFHPL